MYVNGQQVEEIFKEFKTKITIGDMVVYVTKKFNWFHRAMIRLFFGIIVENVGNDENI